MATIPTPAVGIFEDRSPIREELHAAIAHLAIPAKISSVVSNTKGRGRHDQGISGVYDIDTLLLL